MKSNYFSGAWRRSFLLIATATLCLLVMFACKRQVTVETDSSAIDVAEDQVFDAILQQYEGKVVLVDFWATWCGPCRQALKEMIPLKESWADQNIVFVYLTGETSPLDVYNEMIPDIHGEHYRVSESQWAFWRKAFEIQGIPTYMIFDQSGELVQQFLGYPGNEELQKVVEALF